MTTPGCRTSRPEFLPSFFLTVMVLLAAVVAARPVSAEDQPQRPTFALPDLEGTTRSITEWDGKIVIINFWATWCSPCVKEIPELVELQNKYRGHDLQLLGIAIEPEAAPVKAFGERLGINYPILISEIEAMEVARGFGNEIGALPFTAIVNRDGKVVYTKQGVITTAEVEAVVASIY